MYEVYWSGPEIQPLPISRPDRFQAVSGVVVGRALRSRMAWAM